MVGPGGRDQILGTPEMGKKQCTEKKKKEKKKKKGTKYVLTMASYLQTQAHASHLDQLFRFYI